MQLSRDWVNKGWHLVRWRCMRSGFHRCLCLRGSNGILGEKLSGFKKWLEKFCGWLCLVHDSYGPTTIQTAILTCYVLATHLMVQTWPDQNFCSGHFWLRPVAQGLQRHILISQGNGRRLPVQEVSVAGTWSLVHVKIVTVRTVKWHIQLMCFPSVSTSKPSHLSFTLRYSGWRCFSQLFCYLRSFDFPLPPPC